MIKQTIEVEGLLEGYKAVAFRGRKIGDTFINYLGRLEVSTTDDTQPKLIVEKIKPRRIVLEFTGEVRKAKPGEMYKEHDGYIYPWLSDTETYEDHEIWHEVKETDITLNSDEPKLSLSVDECKALCKRLDILVVRKIEKFIKENS